MANDRNENKWKTVIAKVFPRKPLSKEHVLELDRWRLGNPLPVPEERRLRIRGRKKLRMDSQTPQGVNCPACISSWPGRAEMMTHYRREHAWTDPNVTTFDTWKCRYCKKDFHCKTWRDRHECPERHDVIDAEGNLIGKLRPAVQGPENRPPFPRRR